MDSYQWILMISIVINSIGLGIAIGVLICRR